MGPPSAKISNTAKGFKAFRNYMVFFDNPSQFCYRVLAGCGSIRIGTKSKMNIVFDLDGTLTDPYDGITNCILHALEELGKAPPPPVSLKWCIGPPLMESFARLLETDDDERVQAAVAIYRKRFGSVGLFENEVYDGITAILHHLRKEGHTLFVATSKPRVYADRIVDRFGLGPYFKRVYGSELDGTRSDKTRLLAYLLKKESIRGSEAVMVGDRRHDMIGARANGMDGVGVLWGYGSREELVASGARHCVGIPQELSTTLNGKPRQAKR